MNSFGKEAFDMKSPNQNSSRQTPKNQDKYTFSRFVIGECNAKASQSALLAAEDSCFPYNPLTIYGITGSGKTHLLKAIENHIMRSPRNRKVLRIDAEAFYSEHLNSIRKKSIDQFKAKYFRSDVLLIDDLQFLQKKVTTQEVLLEIFDNLMKANKQIIFTSDRSFLEYVDIHPDFRRCLEGGLLIEINSPILDVKNKILMGLSDTSGIYLPEEVLEYMAMQASSDIGIIESNFNKVVAYGRIYGKTISIDIAKKCLPDYKLDHESNEDT